MENTTHREEQLFLAALEIESPKKRNEYLEQQCADDSELRRRVDELIGFHQSDGKILDDTSEAIFGDKGDHAVDDSITVGAQIGPYKLLQEIGLGGMGVVFMAEQSEPIRRKVAVKVIKLGMDTRNVIARFEAERQALALMDHPNITRVLDAGRTESGRPYFVMELVTGMAITDYCDKKRLSLRKRIELFYQVCAGIQHAHQKGIIHRDLKPSNVMVTHYDGVAVPKIIDFGIAKAVDKSLTDKTLFTSYGNMIGTPEYMSPEQAEMSGLDIDTRSDVYSLGVLMYELLTGTTPFYHWKKKGIHRFCEAICKEEPELASTRVNNLASTINEISHNRGTDNRTLNKILKGDIDWILAKAMAKDRNQRYETAADLARDVNRYLLGQPIEAAGPNLTYRVRKLVGKHRTSIGIAAILLISLIGATIVSTAFAFRAVRSENLASARLEEVDSLRREAETERDRARDAESQLRTLERQSRFEAATARAIARYKEEFPKGTASFHFPTRIAESPFPPEFPDRVVYKSMQSSDSPNPSSDSFRFFSGRPSTESMPQIPAPGVSIQIRNLENVDGKSGIKAAMVLSVSEGDMTLLAPHPPMHLDGFPGTNDPAVVGEIVMVRNISNGKEAREFLELLVDEQRDLFGPDDLSVASTLGQMGILEIENEDWLSAENSLRQCREILKKSHGNAERVGHVELMLSKALLSQDKVAAAKATLSSGLKSLKSLENVPPELG